MFGTKRPMRNGARETNNNRILKLLGRNIKRAIAGTDFAHPRGQRFGVAREAGQGMYKDA